MSKRSTSSASGSLEPAVGSTGIGLVDAIEAAANTGKRRRLLRRDTDTCVAKILKDHFADFQEVNIDVILFNNLTLRQTLTRDKRSQKSGNDEITMGKNYYQVLRSRFEGQSSSMARLAVKDSSQEVRPDLRLAMKAFKSRPCNREPMLYWMRENKYLCNKETVGIAKSVITTKAALGTTHSEYVLSCMRWFQENNVAALEPEVFAVVRPHFDESLAFVWGELKKDSVKLKVFWDVHGPIASMVVPSDDVDKLLAAEGEWTTYRMELERVCSSGILGKKMFSQFHGLVVADSVKRIMTAFSLSIASLPCISKAAVTPIKDLSATTISELSGLELLPMRREVQILYRGIPCTHTIISIQDELDRRLMSEAKGRAAQSGALVLLMFEDVLVPESGKKTLTAVDSDMVDAANHARKKANSLILSETDKADGETALKVLKMKEKILSTLDRSFNIELAFIQSMTGDAGELFLVQKVILCLPADGNPKTTQQSLTEMSAVFASGLYAFPGKSARAAANHVREMVTDLHLGRRPASPDKDACASVKKAFESLEWFAKLVLDDGSIIYGKTAVQQLFDEAAKKVASGEYGMEDLKFGVYHWLLNTQQQADLKVWTGDKWRSLGVVVPFEGASGKDPDEKKNDKTKILAATVDKAVDDMFA